MKLGYVADVHLGSGVEGDTLGLLERIAAEFADRGVERVVLLGDVATGEDPDTARERMAAVREVFDGVELYATAGNGDPVEVLADVFERGPNAVVAESEDAATVLVDSATPSEHHAGRIDPAGLDLVEDAMAAGKRVTVAAHHPLQRTEHLPPLFASQPEFAYPDNRKHLEAIAREEPGTLERVVCGHLHPNGKLRVRGDPLDVKMDVLEPVVRIDSVYGEDAERSLNERIAVEDLVYEV